MVRFLMFVWCWLPGYLYAQNDLQVLGPVTFTPESLTDGAAVTYLIRFQNISNDTVHHLVVRDTLDPRLDPSSIKVSGASHSYQMLYEGGSVIRWYFNYIRLPDSTVNRAASVGFIVFKVRPKTFIAPGEIIRNRACTHFDTLYSLCTNDAFVWIDADANTDDTPNAYRAGFIAAPNPNYGTFDVVNRNAPYPFSEKHPSLCWVTDMQGRRVWSSHVKDAAQANQKIILERPASGLYMLWVSTGEKTFMSRFTVLK